MAPSTDKVKKPQRRFQFIDNNDVSSGSQYATKVRRHVMQEHMRAKRHEARIKAESSANAARSSVEGHPPLTTDLPVRHGAFQLYSTWTTEPQQLSYHQQEFESIDSPFSDQSAVKVEKQDDGFSGTSSSPEQILVLSRKPLNLTAASFAALADYLPAEPISPSFTNSSGSSFTPPRSSSGLPSPNSVLSAARTDPFDVLPIARTQRREDKEIRDLFDFYAFTMPSCTYGFDRQHHKAHNWYRDIFVPEAMKGPVTFRNTVLAHAANTLDWAAGGTHSELAAKYRGQAISALNAHYLKHPTDLSDEVITATMSAAALDDFDPRISQKPTSWLHWNAAMNKIRQAGGPEMLRFKPSLRKLINWQDYIFSGYHGFGSSFYFTPDTTDDMMDDTTKRLYGKMEIAAQCEEFLTFLKCSEHLAAAHVQSLSHLRASTSKPWRLVVFENGHPLFVLLASSNQERYSNTGHPKQIISRLAALMTINVVLWEYRYEPELCEMFFQELDQNIRNNELHKNISVEALTQILLSGSEHAELKVEERPWLVGRLLKVAKRLSRESWERLNQFLLLCLTLNVPQGSIMNVWEAQLRSEVLKAPLVCYRLPLMQG